MICAMQARMGRIDELKGSISFNEYRGGSIVIPPGPRLGEEVISCENLSKKYGDRVLFENLSLTIPRASIVGMSWGKKKKKHGLMEKDFSC